LATYLEIAENEYKFLIETLEIGDYANVAYKSQQASEKYLKHLVEIKGEPSKDVRELLHTHSLQSLYRYLKNTLDIEIELDISELSLLTSLYYDVRYPNINYFIPDKREAMLYIEITKEIRRKVLAIIEE